MYIYVCICLYVCTERGYNFQILIAFLTLRTQKLMNLAFIHFKKGVFLPMNSKSDCIE